MVYKVEHFKLDSLRVLQLTEETERATLTLPHFLGAYVFHVVAHTSMEGQTTPSGLIVPSAQDMELLGMPTSADLPLAGGSVETRTAGTVTELVANALVTGNKIRNEGYDAMIPMPPEAELTPDQQRAFADVGDGLIRLGSEPEPSSLRVGLYL